MSDVLEFNDNDDEHMRSMKSELQLTLAMSTEDRKVFYRERAIEEDERHLQWMIDQNKQDDEHIAYALKRAKQYTSDIATHGEEPAWIEAAEQWVEIAQGMKKNKYTIADIRKQRERIQWQKNQLKKMTSQPTESKQSSSPSKT